jgi:hypothetical protein
MRNLHDGAHTPSLWLSVVPQGDSEAIVAIILFLSILN